MEAVPDDLLQHDMSTFPRDDPSVLAKQAQVNAAAEKEQKARAAAEAKERKAEEALVKKSLAMPTKAQKAATVDVKAVKSREMTAHKIRLYFKKLGHLLTIKEPKTLPKDEEGLAELLAAIETELHSKGGIDMASKGLLGLTFGFEQLTLQFNPLGLQLSGPTASLTSTVQSNRAEWDDLVTEFAIAHAEYFVVGPGKRLLGFMVQMVQIVDAANKAAVSGQRKLSPEEQKAAEEL